MTDPEAIEDIYELTPMQQGMLFHSLLQPGEGVYVEQLSCDVKGDLPLDRWKAAWQAVLDRHPILRSGFLWEGLDKPLQVVTRGAVLPWHIEDLRHLGKEAQERYIAEYSKADRARGFPLDVAPLVRCALFRTGEREQRFLWTHHHLLLDGWCLSIVLREVLEGVDKGVDALPPPAPPYREYISWLQAQDPGVAKAFWIENLRGFEDPAPIPFAHKKEQGAPPGEAQPEIIRHLSKDLTARLTAFANEKRLTLNTVLQGAWAVVLGRTSDRDDVAFGVTISGRPTDLPGAQGIVGLFINTVPLRVKLDDGAPIATFLAGIQSRQADVDAHGYASLADIQSWSDAPHDRPLFDSLLVFENYPMDRRALLERSDLEITGITANERISYPLAIVAMPGESLEIRTMYDPAILSAKAAERIMSLLEATLTAFTTASTLGDVTLLDEPTLRVLAELGQNPRRYDEELATPERIAAQAKRTPGAVAVVGPDGTHLTYAELEERAEGVAAQLRGLGVGPEALVGVNVGRSIDLVVGLYGVMKAGGAYVPLDPGYPTERLSYVVGDAKPKVILVSGDDTLGERTIPRIDVRAIAPIATIKTTTSLDQLAYVVYTSGSTGNPKGVMVSHRNLANLIGWHTETFGLAAKDRTTQVASVAFDAAVWEIWPTLCAGAALYVVPSDLAVAPADLADWIVRNGITISFMSTPIAEAAVGLGWPKQTALRFLLTGGDRLHTYTPTGLPFQLVNNYGPTETTVVATSGVVPNGGEGLPSIGRPLGNARIYVLDRQRRQLPPGITGELYIGGAGVARGYLNRPELTAERFVRDPYSEVPGAKMYASGDLASFNPDGTIAFHGRRDRQVQVRGVRVEPGEIEGTLASHPDVAAAAVVSEDQLQNGDVRLVAFAAPKPGSSPEPKDLASWLAARLPAPLLPTRILLIDELPLTPNGKVDYAKLTILAKPSGEKKAYVAPRTLHEEVLASIWCAVLGKEQVGTNEDFFEIGGHSLKATQVVARAREAFGVDLPVRLVFEKRTIAALAESLLGGGAAFEAIPRTDLSKDVPAAPGQERLWFIDALSGASSAYNVPLILRLEGELDIGALTRSLELLVDRHEALRTTFHGQQGNAMQRIGPRPAQVLVVEDLQPEEIALRVRAEVERPFSLTEGPLFRAHLFRAGSRQTLLINQHHIIADAWSLAILLRELGFTYGHFIAAQTPELPELPIRYADWSVWQQQRLASGQQEQSFEFWKKALAGAPPSLELPSDRPRPATMSYRGTSKTFFLADPLGKRLEALARSSGASLFMTVLGAFAAYLSRMSGQDDLVIGVPAANRDRRETEGVVGFFLNTLAMRIDLSGSPTFAELIQRVRKSALEAYAHQDVPFERVVAALGIPRDLAFNPLFQVMFTIQGESSEQMRLGDLAVTLPAIETTTAKFDLTLVVEPRSDGLACIIEYSTDLFDESRIDKMIAHLGRALKAVADDPEIKIADLPILSEEERKNVEEWSRGPRVSFPSRLTVPELIANHAKETPHATALVGPDGLSISFKELDQRASGVAERLRAMGVGKETLVGVGIGRSTELVIAELAAMRAGGAFLPLDPGYPKERLSFILADARPRVILTSGPGFPVEGHAIPMIDVRTIAPAHFEPAPSDVHALAYVIYTSGSTGQPKGVEITHRSLLNLIGTYNADFKVTAADRSTQIASVAFDATVWEIWPTLAAGGAIYVVPPDLVASPVELARFLVKSGITISFLPTPLAEAVLTNPWPEGGALRFMHAAGDRLHVYAPPGLPFALVNAYGPTEATVGCIAGVVGTEGIGLPSIGRPLSNAAIYLLDQHKAPVPPGSVGEIHVGGLGVARGYLNRPELTEERFTPDPFSHAPGARMYATGDLGSFNSDGTIAFHGRRDRQVKIRGVRIEPGEIETTLADHPSVIAAAVVVDKRNNDAQLVAFVAQRGTAVAAELQRYLAAQLPAAMVPSRIIVGDDLPMTPNGKVDYHALVARIGSIEVGAKIEPRNPEEAALVEIWSEVLGRSGIGVTDDFFELGGHSLKATQVVSRVRERLGVDLPVRLVFEKRTIAELAEAISGQSATGEAIPRLEADLGSLAPGQESLWFIDALGGQTAAYNVPMVLRMKGELDRLALERTIEMLVERHEALRTTFDGVAGSPIQKIGPRPFSILQVEETTAERLERRLTEEVALPFSLQRGPIFRARLFILGERDFVLVMNAHHIVIDAWSLGVVLRELNVIYAHLVGGKEPVLPRLPIRFLDWASWQKDRLDGGQLEASLEHWRRALKGAPELLTLPTDRPRPERQSFQGKLKSFILPAPLGRDLEAIGRTVGASTFMTVLAAFGAYLAKISGQDDLVIGSPAANRDRREAEGVVGYFLNTLALRLDLSGDPSFVELLKRTKQTSLDAFAHQEVPFERVVSALGIPRDLSRNPLFQVMFTIQGQGGGKLQMPGLEVTLPETDSPTSKFDLTLFAELKDDGLNCSLEYSTDLFDDDRIERMAGHLGRLLRSITEAPTRKLSELEYLSAQEGLALADLNRTAKPYADRTLPELFASQLAKSPHAIAVEHRGSKRTYQELDQEAEALADRLVTLGVGPDTLVSFCLDRSIAAMVSILAILKAGGAYVPLDPSYPKDRLAYMLEASKARVLLTERKYQDLFATGGLQRIFVEDLAALPAVSKPPRQKLASRNLAYVLYTSGSTGKPKGVAMPHRALVNLIEWQNEGALPERTLQFAPLSFDVSFQETFSTWCSGGTLVLVDEATRKDPDALVKLLGDAKVQRLFLPAVVLHHVAQAALRNQAILPELTEVITAGDQLRITDPIRNWFSLGKRRLHNHYGPTESHVVTAYTLKGEPERWPGIPSIGGPIANSSVYVLDAQRRPVPLGVPGELYLAGRCLADGYLHRPELTAERFVEIAPFGKPLRAYKTGDLGRLFADGSIEFLGRADDQVKLRGFRVEPGEIERALCAHPQVGDAAVIIDGSGNDKRLIAYVVAEESLLPSLGKFLAADLPEYMVPSLFVALPALPRTPSGKVDRRGLPEPKRAPLPEVGMEGRTPTEEIVALAFEQVLNRPRVGRNEDFFALGGHSLLAMQVVARLRESFTVEVGVTDLFESPTVAGLALALDKKTDVGPRFAKIEKAPGGSPIPLSFSQERLWFLDQLHQKSSAYNLPMALRLRGSLDVDAIKASLDDIVKRHAVLGVRFVERDGGVWQEPSDLAGSPFELIDAVGKTPAELQRAIVEEASRPFDLAKGPLFRAVLFRLGPEEHVVVSTMHHTVGDGWSISVLVRELSSLYIGRVTGIPAMLAPLEVDYLDYAHHQRLHLAGEVLDKRLDHWRQRLAGAPDALTIPSDRPRPPKPTLRGSTERISLGRVLSGELEALCKKSGATPFMVLLGAFTAYLSRISGQDDIVVGTPVANRERRELEPLIGFFVGTVPIRVDLANDPTFTEMIARAKTTALDAFANQDIPLEKIVDAVQPERHLGHAPLFQVMLVLQNTPASNLSLPGLQVEAIDFEIGTSKSDLALILESTADGFAGSFEYSTDLFDADRIARMVQHLELFLGDAVAHPEKKLSELALLPERERAQVWSFGLGTVRSERSRLIHEQFESHVAIAPNAVALECAGKTLTYAQLNEKANRFAHHLIAMGAGPEKLIGLCVPRSFETIIGLLGIWKAGAAYVPLDPAYPKARLDDIVADSGARLLVTTHAAAAKWTPPGIHQVWIDEAFPSSRTDTPKTQVTPTNVAYVIYTSGSTGRPKGVVLQHGGLANVPDIHRLELGVDASTVVLQFASISFDASVWEIVMALGSGGRLVMVPADTLLAGDELANVLTQSKVTHAILPPTSLLALPEDRDYSSLRHLTSAGEACPPEVVKRWATGQIAFYNGYGPTESTICTTLGRLRADDVGPPTIGRPALNLEGLVLDKNGKLQPIGVPGELFIGGIGLARGYLNREELTKAKFVPDPFRPGQRLYRSGDLTRWRKDGKLEYLGRIDDQVKLRGFRIELGEIEAALGTHPAVGQSMVVVHSAGTTKMLVAYCVKKGDVDAQALRLYAKARLPEFMVPAEVVLLDAFPLTPNGKVDKKKLPAPKLEAVDAKVYVAPRSTTEVALAEIWEKLLEKRPIGVHDDFFTLGGHSLLAAQVMSRVRKTFKVDVALSAIFELPTLEGLAAVIASKEGAPELPPLVRASGTGDRPLSFAQERLRFLAELEGDSAAYNIPVALRLKGSVSKHALHQTLLAVIERHEVLRTHFPIADGRPVARLGKAELPLVEEDLRGLPPAILERRLADESSRAFKVGEGPLVRAHVFQLGAEEHVLLVVMHHIVSDGWSIGVLMRELSQLYAGFASGSPVELPPLPIQYADYATWQRSWLDGEVRDRQIAYWKSALAGAPSVLDLPTDRPRPPVRTYRGGVGRVELGADTTRALLALGRDAGATPYMSLLAGFGAYLGRVSGQDDLVIGSPFAGRRLAETEPLIGFFVNTLPLRIDLGGDPTFLELLARVRRQALFAQEHQDLPFEKMVEELKPERILGTTPLFQVMFALQQTHKGGMDLPGLEIEPVQAQSGAAKFDLTLSLSDGPSGIAGGLEYDLDLFDAARIEAMSRQLVGFIARLIADPGVKISDLELLSPEERRPFLPKPFAGATPLASVFEVIADQARRVPETIAVESDAGTLTYRALDEGARKVAAELVRRGVVPETLVGLCTERSLETMIGLLGILKAGCAYVPLDPAYPKERLDFMIADSDAPVVVTTSSLADRFPGKETLCLDRPLEDRPLAPIRGALAYCLYTSGSTGQPKGVLIDHLALAHHMKWMAEAMPLGPDDRVVQRTSLSFDASVWELFAPLMVGARLVLAPHDVGADTERLIRTMAEKKVTVLQTVPSLLGALVEDPSFKSAKSLRRACAGGEPLPAATVKRVFEIFGPTIEVWNLYGPTECTIDATAHRCRPETAGKYGAIEPIGPAITGMQALILDPRLRPVPDGVPGELYLAGACVGRGYWNRPALTAERFLEHTFENGVKLRMYKTGDVVRRHLDGTIGFLGRADRQVKLRGFRIELGEVEAAIARHPGVREAAALTIGKGGDARLVAFVIPRNQPVPGTELKRFVEKELAGHMVPSAFVTLDALPHAPNGKVDYRALEQLKAPEPARERGPREAPRDDLELEVVRLFEEILGVSEVGIHDNFFELGGHSLLLLRVHARLREALGQDLALMDLFRYPTIAALAHHLDTPDDRPIAHDPNASAQERARLRREAQQSRRRTPAQPHKDPHA